MRRLVRGAAPASALQSVRATGHSAGRRKSALFFGVVSCSSNLRAASQVLPSAAGRFKLVPAGAIKTPARTGICSGRNIRQMTQGGCRRAPPRSKLPRPPPPTQGGGNECRACSAASSVESRLALWSEAGGRRRLCLRYSDGGGRRRLCLRYSDGGGRRRLCLRYSEVGGRRRLCLRYSDGDGRRRLCLRYSEAGGRRRLCLRYSDGDGRRRLCLRYSDRGGRYSVRSDALISGNGPRAIGPDGSA